VPVRLGIGQQEHSSADSHRSNYSRKKGGREGEREREREREREGEREDLGLLWFCLCKNGTSLREPEG